MERVMSQEERIRRAEEIYYRRRNQGVSIGTTSVSLGKQNKVSLGKKMVVQLIVCICIYGVLLFCKNGNSKFSKQTIETTANMLNYDINLAVLYNNCVEYFNGIKNNYLESINKNVENVTGEDDLSKNNLNTENDNAENSPNINNLEENNQNISSAETNEAGIGGLDISQEQIENQNKSQMELDAEYVKQNCSLIIPVKGYITSGFGNREPTEIISAFHQGIDIGAIQGTPINASMEGTVVAASYAGDYGNHIKIQNGDVLTVYAHCSEINVSVGDYINQNQIIGKVGATRKSNRTSFAF